MEETIPMEGQHTWKYRFHVPENKRVRVIVDTDCKNEADDQYALAHHLMTHRFDVRGIVSAHFDGNSREYGRGNTERASYDEILKILELMGLQGRYPVYHGAPRALVDETAPVEAEGVDFIIREALREDDRPLYIACQGTLSNVASALLLRPEIAGRMTVIWVGGGDYPAGGVEFNLSMDIAAANVVFSSQVPVWQLPMGMYKEFAVSLAELQWKVYPCGAIGAYLFEQMVETNEQFAREGRIWPHGEVWGLGDQASVAVLMEELERVSYDMVQAPTVLPDMSYSFRNENRPIRVYRKVDSRMVLEDFFAKLAINFGGGRSV